MRRAACKFLIVFVLIILICASACAPASHHGGRSPRVTVLNGEHYVVIGANRLEATEGTVEFEISVDDGYVLVHGEDGEYTVVNLGDGFKVAFNDVKYDVTVQLKTELYSGWLAAYDVDGDGIYDIMQDCESMLTFHPRANTLTERNLVEEYGFQPRENSTLIGWQTDEGEFINLGSRVKIRDNKATFLTAVWKAWTASDKFQFQNGVIKGWDGGAEEEIVIPAQINGQAVTSIDSHAFESCSASVYYLPGSVTAIKENAFLNCTALTDFYMSDNIEEISDTSFTGCKNFTTLHLNAYLPPKYKPELKLDLYDAIYAREDESFLLFFGGSSVYYAYNSVLTEKMFDGKYQVLNLGFNAGISGLPQYEIIQRALKPGDIFVAGLEPYTQVWYGERAQSALTGEEACKLGDEKIFFKNIVESNLQFLENLTINQYCDVFDSLNRFNQLRKDLPARSYQDDVGISKDNISGLKGDLSLPESGNEDANWYAKFDLNNITGELIRLASAKIYAPLIEKQVNVFITFSTINANWLQRNYQDTKQQVIDDYTNRVVQNMDGRVKILLTQSDMVYEGRYFCDFDLHIGAPMRDEHTRKVISALLENI